MRGTPCLRSGISEKEGLTFYTGPSPPLTNDYAALACNRLLKKCTTNLDYLLSHPIHSLTSFSILSEGKKKQEVGTNREREELLGEWQIDPRGFQLNSSQRNFPPHLLGRLLRT